VVDLLLKGQLGALHRLPVDSPREIVRAVALKLLEQNIVRTGELGPWKIFCEYPNRYVTFESGCMVRLVSVMRRTVLNKNGDCFTCGQAYEPVGAAVGPMGID
jgi:hypothetical protein